MLHPQSFATGLVAEGLGAYGPKLERPPKETAIVEVSYRPPVKTPLNKRKRPHNIGLASHEKFQLNNACGKSNIVRCKQSRLLIKNVRGYAAKVGQVRIGDAPLDLLLMTEELAGDVQAVVAFTTAIITCSLRP